MNTLMHFLLLILVALSYNKIVSLVTVEARKLNSHAVFTVDFIHRNSLPQSTFHNNSNTPLRDHHKRTFGSVSRGHQIRLSSAYYDSKDVQSDIIPNGGDYVMKIAIGTPPVEFTANADTGSDLIWLQCAPCQNCLQQQSPLFDPTKSSTYQTIPCDSQSCNVKDFTGGCGSNNQCEYKVRYGDDTRSNGVIGTDTITFPSSKGALQSTIFGCGFDQQGNLGPIGDGIIGLGTGPSSLVSQLGESINYKFSYCLAPLTSGVTSKLKFGADVTGTDVVSTPFTIQDPPTFYYLTLNGISIGDSQVQVGQDIIIDSGTTLTYLETSVYNGLRTALSDAIALRTMSDPDGVFDLCYDINQTINPPDVVFHFEGADVLLKAENTFRALDSVKCLAMLPTNGNTFIFGNIAQVNYEVGYDVQAKKVSFAPKDCTNY